MSNTYISHTGGGGRLKRWWLKEFKMCWWEFLWEDSIRESVADMEKGFIMGNHVIKLISNIIFSLKYAPWGIGILNKNQTTIYARTLRTFALP